MSFSNSPSMFFRDTLKYKEQMQNKKGYTFGFPELAQCMLHMFKQVLFPQPKPNKVFILLFNGKVSAGFPSPADDYVQKTLDLNELLIQ